MTRTTPEHHKALGLEAFDTLFTTRDDGVFARDWSPNDRQHRAHIGPGREGRLTLVKSLPPELTYEPGMIVAAGDLVMLPGRCSGVGQPTAWIAVDILRLLDGVLAEPWDVSQDEATRASSTSGLPMFGEPCGA